MKNPFAQLEALEKKVAALQGLQLQMMEANFKAVEILAGRIIELEKDNADLRQKTGWPRG